MSSFKADPRYTHRYDDVAEPVSDDTEESDYDNTPVLQQVLLNRERQIWRNNYLDDVLMCYNSYLEVGRAVFGGAFHQNGTLTEFADFVFKYMQPGATKSNT